MNARIKTFHLLTLATLATGFLAAGAQADDWPQWRGAGRDGVWRETGIIDHFDRPQVPIAWRAKVGGGYSGPTVAKGRVFVMDRLEKPTEVERVLCFDAKTGKELWTHSYNCPYQSSDYKVGYPSGPRASVSIDAGRAYSVGTMGHMYCLDSEKGAVLWSHDLKAEYKIRMPIWGISASPVVEGDLVIAQIGGSDNACVVAFDKKTGKERWRALNDRTSYAAPIVIDQASHRVLVVYTGDNVVGLNPMTGDVYWTYPFPPEKRTVIGIATPVLHDDMLFMTSFYDGSLLLKLSQDTLGVSKVWKRVGVDEKNTDALHSIISTPYLSGGYIYGVDSYGELRCLDIKTGDRVWESLAAVPKARWATIHFVENGNNVWMFNERGELIISKLSPKGFQEISRAKLIAPTTDQLRRRGGVCWSHPAFANRHVFARNGEELVCADLSTKAD